MFKVVINDGSTPMPEDDIYYIICKEGMFLKKKLGVMESIAPVKNISILNSVESMAKMHIKKIPRNKFAQVVGFFKAIYGEHHAEAMMLDYYNQHTKVHKLVPPFQKVSFASVEYTKNMTIEDHECIGTIHSHANMSAFHSGTDSDDEKNFDGLHITIGNVDDDLVSLSASIVANGTRFIVDPLEYIEGIELVKDIDEIQEQRTGHMYYTWDSKEKKLVPGQSIRKVRVYDKRYRILGNMKFIKNWLKFVEKKQYQTTYQSTRVYPTYPNGHFQSEFWDEYLQRNNYPQYSVSQGKVIDSKDKEQKISEDVMRHYTEIVDEDEYNPCKDCVFRDDKIDWVLKQITQETDDDDDDDDDDDEYARVCHFLERDHNDDAIDENAKLYNKDDRSTYLIEDGERFMEETLRMAGDPESIKEPEIIGDPRKNETIIKKGFRGFFHLLGRGK